MGSTKLCIASIAALLLALAPGAAAQETTWVDFVDESAERFVGPANQTTDDSSEMDLAVADLDGDGDDDVVSVRKARFSSPGQRRNVLLMNEGGVLVDRSTELIPGFSTKDDSRDVIAFDADNDGWLDLVVCNTFGDDPRLFRNLGADAGGTFLGWEEALDWYQPAFRVGPKFCAVASGDVNGDGYDDLFFVDYDNDLEDRLLINDGTGNFDDETRTRLGDLKISAFGTSGFIEDLNGDGHADILKLSTKFPPSKIAALYNDGTGHFDLEQELEFDAAYMLEVADFDSDGRPDVYVVSDTADYILFNDATNADGTIVTTRRTATKSTRTADFGGNCHAMDVNRDGYLDVGVADVDTDFAGCQRRFGLLNNRLPSEGLRGVTDPNFGLDPTGWNTQGTFDIGWLDLDGDGFVDLLAGTCDGLQMWMQVPFAVAAPFGPGCVGGSGTEARAVADSPPSLGNADFAITLTDAPAGRFAGLLIGTEGVDGAGACALAIGDPLLFVPFTTDADGTARFAEEIPNDPALEGLRLFGQWIVRDPHGASPSGWALSSALELYFSARTLP